MPIIDNMKWFRATAPGTQSTWVTTSSTWDWVLCCDVILRWEYSKTTSYLLHCRTTLQAELGKCCQRRRSNYLMGMSMIYGLTLNLQSICTHTFLNLYLLPGLSLQLYIDQARNRIICQAKSLLEYSDNFVQINRDITVNHWV